MSSIYLIDYYANSYKSPLHQRHVITKIIFLLLILAAIIFSRSIPNLIFILGVIIILLIITRLPWLKILKWSLYPAFFALIFALSQIKYGWLPLETMLRATTAALLMLLIICTTPYPAIFSQITKLSPDLANIFFLAYRFFFLLVEEIQTKAHLLKIRGGYAGGIQRTLKNVSAMTAHVFIYALEKSEKISESLSRRGYQGKIYSRLNYPFKRADLVLISLGLITLLISLSWRW